MFLPFVHGYMGVVKPNGETLNKGSLVDGDTDSFQTWEDDDVYEVNGVGWPLKEIELHTWFENKPNVGEDNGVWIRYKYTGTSMCILIIFYWHGGNDVFAVFDTDGDFELNFYPIEDDKAVYDVYFDIVQTAGELNLQVDYIGAYYGLA
ncbi:hypothetical protein LCGC14_1691260 [marine sediment metagenome]|uniref:Uncharacterized protein n=1 Tax=marine sediment metagenome TaxID=412755 RepID=A0A0F9HKM8_9ZZZZ|nr:hypothetical protein [bacterium]